jgi:uroporphyrinogen III methyltransferase/synthase
MSGFVSLVGAGPGDPGLLTLAGRDRLAAAEVVVYDRLVNPAILAHAETAELIYAGKSPEGHTLTQDQINALLVEKARAGKRVVRLKGGDPFVFGRGGEEALALVAAGLPFEVIPGVTSAIAAPAYAGVPVTHRRMATSFAVITGHEDASKAEDEVDWRKLATAVDTLVILMGAGGLPSIAAALIEGGRPADTPAISIEWGTLPRQRSVTASLSRLAAAVAAAGLGAPLLTVVGDVASLHDKIGWFEGLPLRGKRVLVTRTRKQASALAELLRREGAIPVELPAIETVPIASTTVLDSIAAKLRGGLYHYCLFLSAAGVDFLADHLQATGSLQDAFAGCMTGAIGSGTAAAIERRGLRVDVTAVDYTSEGLLAALALVDDLAGKHVLIPRGEDGATTLPDGLRKLGAVVDEVVLYASRPPKQVDAEALALVREGKIDIATFASSSSVRNLAALLGDDFRVLDNAVIASIGPVTTAAARELGLSVTVEPSEHTIPALVAAIREYYEAQRS